MKVADILAVVAGHFLRSGGDRFTRFFDFDGFDVVLGADVVYDERALAPLGATVATLLKPIGIFVLAFTHRGVNIEGLLDLTSSAGFVMEDQTSDDANPLDRLLVFQERRL